MGVFEWRVAGLGQCMAGRAGRELLSDALRCHRRYQRSPFASLSSSSPACPLSCFKDQVLITLGGLK